MDQNVDSTTPDGVEGRQYKHGVGGAEPEYGFVLAHHDEGLKRKEEDKKQKAAFLDESVRLFLHVYRRDLCKAFFF